MSDIVAFKDGRDAAYSEIRAMLEEMGGCDATEDWTKGWDAAIDEIERRMDKEQRIKKHWLYKGPK